MATTNSPWANQRTAIVTGAASGIGLAVAQRLAAEGAAVALFDRDSDGVGEAAETITASGAHAAAVTVDVAERDDILAAVHKVRADLGPPTILVNSAGLDGFDRFLDITPEVWQRIIAVNLTGTFDCCQAVVPSMADAKWGRIVNISSSSAQTGNPFMTHYSAAKAGVVGLTKAMALELGPKGITVNTIPPGFICTPMLRTAESRGFLGEGIEAHEGTTPVQRVGLPEDVAAACAYLVRDEASYITGQIIPVNGGRTTS